MFCPNCGKENLDEARFCVGCGTALNSNLSQQQPQQQNQMPPQYQQPYTETAPNYGVQPSLPDGEVQKPKSCKKPVIITVVAIVAFITIMVIFAGTPNTNGSSSDGNSGQSDASGSLGQPDTSGSSDQSAGTSNPLLISSDESPTGYVFNMSFEKFTENLSADMDNKSAWGTMPWRSTQNDVFNGGTSYVLFQPEIDPLQIAVITDSNNNIHMVYTGLPDNTDDPSINTPPALAASFLYALNVVSSSDDAIKVVNDVRNETMDRWQKGIENGVDNTAIIPTQINGASISLAFMSNYLMYTITAGDLTQALNDNSSSDNYSYSGSEIAGSIATVIPSDGLNIRKEPSTSSDIVVAVRVGKTMTITGDAIWGDGYNWYPVEYEGQTGYAAAEFLMVD